MTKQAVLCELEDQLELPRGTLREGVVLATVAAWDSMAVVVFMGIADEKLQLTLSGDDIAAAKTVQDLLALLGDRVSD